MFESVLNPARTPARRWSVSALAAIGAHAALLALAIGIAHDRATKAIPRDVTFIRKAMPVVAAQPAPLPAAAKRTRAHPTDGPRRPKVLTPPTVIPTAPPPMMPMTQAEDQPDDGDDQGIPEGVPDGVTNGAANGVVGGAPSGRGTGPKRLEFNEGSMVRPVLLSGPPIEYTPQALDHEVEGLISVRCALLTDGSVHDCRVLKSLPFLDREVVETLQARKYQPVLFQGQPVEVNYQFNIRMTLP